MPGPDRGTIDPAPKSRSPWLWFYRPLPLSIGAILIGWLGVILIYRGVVEALLLPLLTTVLAVVALRRGRGLGQRRHRELLDVVAAAETRTLELGALRTLAGAMLAARTRDELFLEVARATSELLRTEGSAVFLLVEEGRFLKVVAGEGLMQRITGALVPVDHSLSGWIVTQNEALIVPDMGSETRLYPIPELEGLLRDAAMVPLRSSGVVLGVLAAVNRRDTKALRTEELRLLQTLADQAAFGLDRVTVLEESAQNEQALAAKNHELERATRLKSEFLANISHELRTPLNAIIGFSDLLLTEQIAPLDSQQKEFLESISRNGNHLLGLINNVLDLSKIEAGRMTQTLTAIDLRVAITSAVADTGTLRSAKRQRATIDLDEGPLEIVADGQRIRQILLNLLANASKFTPEEGEITLRAVMTQAPLPVPSGRAADRERLVTRKAVWVAVTDTGIGIKPDDLSKLFVAFSQVDASSSRRAQGTGLGLVLCKQFVEMQGGTIGVESIFGKGSTFWFLLPVDGPIRRGGGTQAEDRS